MKKVKYKFSYLFVLLSIAILLFDSVKNFVIYFIVVAIHELSHSFIAKRLGYKLNKFYIMPYGACLNYSNNLFCANDELYISIAGPLVNILICVLCFAIWWLFPTTYYYLDYFCFCNLMLASFNLLPCFPLDGGRVFVFLLSKKIDREKAYKISLSINYIFSFLLIIAFCISCFNQINFSFLFIAIFLFAGTISPNKYTSYDYVSLSADRKNLYKKSCSVKIFAVDSSMALYKIIAKFSKYKFNIIYVIFKNHSIKVYSEININNLAVKYSPVYNLEEISLLQLISKE